MFIRFCAIAIFLTATTAVNLQAEERGQALSPDAIRTLVSGKTVREYYRGNLMKEVYYRADGQGFLVKPDRKGGYQDPVATPWEVKDSYICRPGILAGRACQSIIRLSDGTIAMDYGSSGRMTLKAVDGDPDQLVAYIEKYTVDAPARARAQAEERRGSVPAGNYLTGEEVRQLVSGKTTRETPTERLGLTKTNTLIYTAADGTGYLSIDSGQTTWRGPWEIDGNRLCLKEAYWPCADFRRTADGKIMKEYGGPRGSRNVELLDGDPEKVAEIVSNTPPYNQPASAQRHNQPKASGPSVLRNTTVQ